MFSGFTNHGCLHFALLEVHEARDIQCFLRNFQHKGFRNFKIRRKSHQSSFSVNSKISNSDKSITLMIFVINSY